MKTAALVLLSLAAPLVAPLAVGQAATLRLGGLETAYDPAALRVERFDGGLVLEGDRTWTRTAAYVEVSETEPCSQEAMRTALGERGDTGEDAGSQTLASGLTLHWATTWTGCRALTGRPVAACIRHDGVTTRVRGLDLGCRTPVDQDMLILTLLQGARPAGESG
ncbi:hypothetical protein [Brevundimonas sp.]|uniref:hypothetical protein n=1 Tax=Brevundimonas sp. TaxID=1871086 RepID=UPI002FD9E392